jgi:hypothetical protein
MLLPTLPLSDWIKKKSVLKSIYSMVSSLSNAKLLLFLPMPVAVGVQRFVFQFIWPSSFRGGDSNVKDYHTDDGCQVITRAHMDFGKMR